MQQFLHRLNQPKTILKGADALERPLLALTLLLFGWGIHQAFIASPPDYQQGELVRIMYVHVPAAWMALLIYTLLTAASATFLVMRSRMAHIAAAALSPIGACFALITLVTGSLWGKPTWGAYWVWDARLTSALILLLFYLAHLALINAFAHEELGARRAAWLAITGFINVPIVKFSVEWWHTLHQPASILPFVKNAIHPAMLKPLVIMATAFLSYTIMVTLWRMQNQLKKP